MPAINKPKKVTRIVNAVQDNIWAIYPPKLDEITAFLMRAETGDLPSDEEVAEVVTHAYGRQNREDLRDLAAWDDEDEPSSDAGVTVNGVRILSLYGTIANRMDMFMSYSGGTSTIKFEQQLRAAVKDPKVKSILIDIDSPGGAAMGTAELATAIFEARGHKPIVAMVRGLMASAAYWIGTAADKVYATESSLVGSIGVLSVHMERSAALEKHGVKYTVFRAGTHKADGNSYEPLTDQSKATFQERIDAIYSEFVLGVARNRNVTTTKVEQDFGQGKVFLANQAANIGMIDAVRTFDSVLRELQGTQATSPSSSREYSSMNQQIKATLFACSLISAQDASDEVCESALATFYMFAGKERPKKDEEIVADLIGYKAKVLTGAGTTSVIPPVETSSGNPTTNVSQAVADALAADNKRRDELIAIGEQLGIDQDVVQAACRDTTFTVEKAQADWRKLAEQVEKPIGVIQPGQAGLDRVNTGAIEGIMHRLGLIKPEDLTEAGRQFANVSLLNISRAFLNAANIQLSLMATDEDIAAAFIDAQFGQGPSKVIYGSLSTAYAAPGRYPNVLDGMFSKIMAAQHMLAPSTFRRWCGKVRSLPNLEMHTIFNTGYFPLFSEIEDKKGTEEAAFDTEVSFVKASRYGRHVTLTPTMIANDDMDFFDKKLRGIVMGHDMTMNVHAVQMLTEQNEIPATGNPLFHVAHDNIITDGGGPSLTEADKIRKKLNDKFDISGEHPARLDFKYALIPTDWETDAQQTFLSLPGYFPAETNKKNVFQGTVDIIKEPELNRIDRKKWYAGEDPTVQPALVYTHQTGFENGRSWRVFDPRTGCVELHVEGRWAIGVQDYRPIVENSGEAEGG